ncbi:DNA N-6-adenine-methyltransferase [Xanthomonas arboricola]|uniref:DNA N-6-adenine-methyltransferase n=1 Tax=Xanthomonas arboricola TaxID=56448 RepID=UPI002B2DE0C2|nr:adenine methyltransferase [Xanthomonas arboricola]
MHAAQKSIRVPASPKVGYDRCQDTTETWLTPPALLKALGPFDLDPATPEGGMPWRTAKRMLKPSDDGLAMAWPKKSFVWLNPPYGRGMDAWISKAADHGNGVALIFARMETGCMHASVLTHPNASAVVFTKGRLSFCREDGTPGKACPMGSLFVGYGQRAAQRLREAVREGHIRGHYLDLASVRSLATDSSAANHSA